MSETFMKYTTIIMVSALCALLFIKASEQRAEKHFQSKIHIIEEWIPNEITGYVMDFPGKNDMIEAVSLYTKNENEAIDYVELILEHSYKNDLNPWLVASVIAKESSYRVKAKSAVGAIGLMQVMPNWRMNSDGAVQWRNRSRSMARKLYEPSYNIKVGTAILKHYLDVYDGNATLALAAYNGSRGSDRYPRAVYAMFDESELPLLQMVSMR